ncbi:hypothetical protein DFJ74DRAFT_398948 [Hyaloraphidium curvatum]|nr:hypothetical protein DFJ74DRAFT_398948 [Hyaloraphidium curvatum]
MLATTTTGRFAARLAGGAIRPSAAIWRSGIPLACASPFHTSAVRRAGDKTLKLDNPFERSEKLGRPLSPHTSIYQPQLTWVMSIMNRVAGVGVGIVFYDYFTMYALAPGSFGGAAAVSAAASAPALLFAGKALVATGFWYHFWAGVRHWVWDLGYFLDLKGVYSTGYFAAVATAVCAIATLAL